MVLKDGHGVKMASQLLLRQYQVPFCNVQIKRGVLVSNQNKNFCLARPICIYEFGFLVEG